MSICLGLSKVNKRTELQAIRALVVDEDIVYQNLLCRLLISHGIQIAGRASSLDQAVLLYKTECPDVVLVDLSAEIRDKLNVLLEIKEIDPLAKLIVLSIFNPFEDIAPDQSRLIDAYVIKGASAREIISTVREVVIGKKASRAASNIVKD